jgi:hypothetical protein
MGNSQQLMGTLLLSVAICILCTHLLKPFLSLCTAAAAQVLYQGEAMVDLLVACQAHNYLEFKLIEGRWAY